MIIVGVDFRDATTATLKEVNTAMNVYGRRKSVRRKRMKQLIAILLAVTMITLATAKPYQEAKATGLGEAAAGAAGLASLSPQGRLLVLGTIVGLGVAITVVPSQFEDGKNEELKKFYDETGEKMKDDFVRYSTQALNNNVSAAEQQRDNAAHARSVIEDWLESAGGGVIDTTSEAWRWFQDFVSDIRTALSTPETMCGYVGKNLDGTYTGAMEGMPKSGYESFGSRGVDIELKGFDMSKISAVQGRDCFLGVKVAGQYAALVICAVNADGSIEQINGDHFWGTDASYRVTQRDSKGSYSGEWQAFRGDARVYISDVWAWTFGLPEVSTLAAAPSGTTDVPGVSNVNDYVAVGSDLPYNRPEGAWDICDPNGKQGQVSIGADIPGKLGYDDWYDLLGGVATGDTTWEEVANASDVITIGSDLANDYSPSNAKDWSAYHDGTIVGYDVDAAGNVTITFEDGAVISIPQEYVSGMEWVNEQDKAQELDKDTALPVSGSLAYPLPAIQDPAVPADPQDPGGGSGDIKIDDDAKNYTLDFRKLFPFCIPFDIYKAVKLLDAAPTAPVVHYKFYYTKSKSYTIDINLNKFNSVAAILRRMECLLFIIGLATATRRIYLRG